MLDAQLRFFEDAADALRQAKAHWPARSSRSDLANGDDHTREWAERQSLQRPSALPAVRTSPLRANTASAASPLSAPPLTHRPQLPRTQTDSQTFQPPAGLLAQLRPARPFDDSPSTTRTPSPTLSSAYTGEPMSRTTSNSSINVAVSNAGPLSVKKAPPPPPPSRTPISIKSKGPPPPPPPMRRAMAFESS